MLETGKFRLRTPDSAENAMNLQRRQTKSAGEENSALFVPLRCYWCHFIFLLPRLISRESSMFVIVGQEY